MARRLIAFGSYGARRGAKTAQKTRIPSVIAPISASRCERNLRSVRRPGEIARSFGAMPGVAATGSSVSSSALLIADSRIDDRIGQVSDQRREEHDDRRHQRNSKLHRIVTLHDRGIA